MIYVINYNALCHPESQMDRILVDHFRQWASFNEVWLIVPEGMDARRNIPNVVLDQVNILVTHNQGKVYFYGKRTSSEDEETISDYVNSANLAPIAIGTFLGENTQFAYVSADLNDVYALHWKDYKNTVVIYSGPMTISQQLHMTPTFNES